MRIPLNYLLITFLSVVLFSCSSDHDIDPDIPIGSDEGWVSLSVGMPKSDTQKRAKGISAISTEVGEKEEQKVNSLRVVFYTNNRAYRTFDLDVQTNSSGDGFTGEDVISGTALPNGNNMIKFTIKPLLLKRNNYKVAAFVNPPESLKLITEEGQDLSLLFSPANLSSVDEISTLIKDGSEVRENFYMGNTSGLIDVKEDLAPGAFHLSYNEALADGDRPVISLERAASKVQFIVTLPVGQPVEIEGYTLDLSGLEWTVDVLNKKLYWLRKLTYKRGGKEEGNMEEPGDYQKYESGSFRLYLYAEDPNFKDISSYGDEDLLKEFSYYNPEDPSSNWEWKSANGVFYIPENTMDANEDFKTNVSTQIILRIPCTPVFEGSAFMYYRIPIRHFVTNALQDIGTGPGEGGPGGEEEVDGGGGFVGSAVRYWGAYGVARNNYYQLSLNGISSLGESKLKSPPNATQNKY